MHTLEEVRAEYDRLDRLLGFTAYNLVGIDTSGAGAKYALYIFREYHLSLQQQLSQLFEALAVRLEHLGGGGVSLVYEFLDLLVNLLCSLLAIRFGESHLAAAGGIVV